MEWIALLADDPATKGIDWSNLIGQIITILTAVCILIKQFHSRTQAAAAEAKAAIDVAENTRITIEAAQHALEAKQTAAAAAAQTKTAIAENTALTKQAVAKVDVVSNTMEDIKRAV